MYLRFGFVRVPLLVEGPARCADNVVSWHMKKLCKMFNIF